MFSILLFSSALAMVSATSYGGGGGGGGGYGHPIDAAVKSQHSVNTYPVGSSQDNTQHPVVDINSGPLPLTLRFNTHSSQINAIQKHFGSPGTVQKANAVDEPDMLIQNIRKPIVQNIREVITPMRQRTQELRPVQEKIETIIASGGGMGGGMGGGGGGGGGKYGGGGSKYY